jgi:two-component system response regulator YesN
MDVNFTDWLNRLRVDKAKNLLTQTNLKTYEIAEKVGYRDYKYFSMVFKKITGSPPQEFKRGIGNMS